MKKNGFVLLETLIATTLIATVFTIMYLEFGTINENYKRTFNNNTVEKLYATNNIKNFILGNGYNNMIPFTNYIDITSCSQFSSKNQCDNLMSVLEVKQALFLPDSILDLKDSMLDDSNISDNLKKFIKSLNYASMGNSYRLIVQFNDGQCATIRM